MVTPGRCVTLPGACQTMEPNKQMNWDDLKTFISVAKTCNVTDAGAALRVSASTVSRKIAALEEALGSALFLKRTNGYFLTEAGQALLPLALEAEERFKLIERQIAHPREHAGGCVRIDCPEVMGTHLIIPALEQVHEQYPDIQFDLVNSALSSKLTHSHSDIIIRLHRPENGNFTMRCLGRLTQGLFCSATYAARHGLPQQPTDLQRHQLIGWTEEMAHMPLARWLHELGNGHKPWLRLQNLNAQINAVATGLGIAALPIYVGMRNGFTRVLPAGPAHGADIWLLRNLASQDLKRVSVVTEHLIGYFARTRTDLP